MKNINVSNILDAANQAATALDADAAKQPSGFDLQSIASHPVFFERNRVYRIYLGGAAYKQIFADGYDMSLDGGEDDYFPEEWVASKVKAINPRYFGRRDGVSVVKGTDVFFDDLLNQYAHIMLGSRKYDCLVKFLDSAVRLPFQVHPTKEFSRLHFNSDYGKTEAWLVIGARNGAKLYFGFKDKISKQQLSALEERSEIEKDVMGNLLAGVDVKVGDLWLIKAGLIHAIGAGCTIIEVQEPTDFTIQPERWCGTYHISSDEEYIGLDKSTALDAINYDVYGANARRFAALSPRVVFSSATYVKEILIGYDDTPCFSEVRHTLHCGGQFAMSYAPSVYICLSGKAIITGENYCKEISRGDYFFLPYVAEGKFSVSSSTDAVLIECLPSKQ